ncbi:MAG: ABC transporter ATP-binding protein, partial [Pseudomonadota bacterium]
MTAATTTEAQASDAPKRTADYSIGPMARRLFDLMKRRRGMVLFSVLFAILAALLSLSPYLVVALTLAALLEPATDWGWIQTLGLLGLAGVALEKICFGLATYLSHRVAFATQRDLRFGLAEKLARVPLGYTDEKSKGEIRSTMIDEMESLEDGMAHLVPEVGAAIIAPLMTLSVLLLIDWRLALLMIVPLMVGVWLMGALISNAEVSTADYMEIQAKMSMRATEMADGVATMRAFNQDEQASRRLRGTFADVARFAKRFLEMAMLPGASSQVLLSSHLLLLGPVGLFMAAAGYVSLPVFAGFLAVAYGFGDLFNAIPGVTHRIFKQKELLDRLDELRNAPEIERPAQEAALADGSAAFENVFFSYGPREVLSGVSFTVPEGGFLALVGPSGSGKSTILRLLGRFQDASQGLVRVGGADVRDLTPEGLHRHIAYVFQDVFLFSGTVAENIRLGRADASDEDVRQAAKAARAHDFISALPQGYDTMLGERGLGLSGGERQRISIA